MKPSFTYLLLWVLVCGATFATYGVWYHTISTASSRVAQLQDQIDAKTRAADHVAVARATLAQIAGDEAAVQNHFVPESAIVPFIDVLESIGRAEQAKMDVRSVATGANPKQPSLVLTLTIDGTFDAVMRTVGTIEYAPYDLSITRFSVTKDGKGVWHAELSITVGSVPLVATSTQATAKSVSFIYP